MENRERDEKKDSKIESFNFFQKINNNELDEDENFYLKKKYKTTNDSNDISIEDILIKKKKKLIELIKDLSRTELLEIFHIFKEAKCSFTENINGIFINITNVDELVIDRVYNFINYIKEKKIELNEIDNKIKEEMNNIKEFDKSIVNKDNYDNYLFNRNFENVNNNIEDNVIELLSDSDDNDNIELNISSDEDENIETKISLKKKKIKYTGTRAKLIKSYKDASKENGNQISSNKKTKTPKEKEEEETT